MNGNQSLKQRSLFNRDVELPEIGRVEDEKELLIPDNHDDNDEVKVRSNATLCQKIRLHISIRNFLRLVLFILVSLLIVFGTKIYGIISGRIDDERYISQTISDWTLVQGPIDRPVIVMLADGNKNLKGFQHHSIQEKSSYAQQYNYTLICCQTSLDKYRSPQWSKLKLLYKVIKETKHELIFWLDVDTIIWDRNRPIELESKYDIMAQLDFHRDITSKYFNNGVLIIRNTEWILNVLKEAYRQYHMSLFQGIFYFYDDQDAMNKLVMAKNEGSISGSSQHLDLKLYGQLWTLFRDARRMNPFVLHFPACFKGRCVSDYIKYYQKAMEKE